MTVWLESDVNQSVYYLALERSATKGFEDLKGPVLLCGSIQQWLKDTLFSTYRSKEAAVAEPIRQQVAT